jgi:2'-5' RNA ligase
MPGRAKYYIAFPVPPTARKLLQKIAALFLQQQPTFTDYHLSLTYPFYLKRNIKEAGLMKLLADFQLPQTQAQAAELGIYPNGTLYIRTTTTPSIVPFQKKLMTLYKRYIQIDNSVFPANITPPFDPHISLAYTENGQSLQSLIEQAKTSQIIQKTVQSIKFPLRTVMLYKSDDGQQWECVYEKGL